MKAAATGTWLGTLITALIVTDMMLQDNLYPNWAPSVRYMNTDIYSMYLLHLGHYGIRKYKSSKI